VRRCIGTSKRLNHQNNYTDSNSLMLGFTDEGENNVTDGDIDAHCSRRCSYGASTILSRQFQQCKPRRCAFAWGNWAQESLATLMGGREQGRFLKGHRPFSSLSPRLPNRFMTAICYPEPGLLSLVSLLHRHCYSCLACSWDGPMDGPDVPFGGRSYFLLVRNSSV
jgi:hypothetical protein